MSISKHSASSAAYDLIRGEESFEAVAYPDPADGEPWTIGYGTTVYPDGTPVKPGDTCTREQAEEWLRYHVEKRCVEPLNAALKVSVNQPMFDALVSWTYNIGAPAMRRSTLIRLVNRGDYLSAAKEFDRWNLAGGVVMGGLVKRRDVEQALFEDGLRSALAFAKEQGWTV